MLQIPFSFIVKRTVPTVDCLLDNELLIVFFWHQLSGFVTFNSMVLSYSSALITGDGWRFDVAVTCWSRSTQLLYVEPG